MYKASKDQFIVPVHLNPKQPYENWAYSEELPLLHFRFKFDNHMPKGLMSKLIVALNQYILDHELVWKRGFNISHKGANAEIKMLLGGTNIFEIQISGFYRRDLLVIILKEFETILSKFQKLQPDKFIKCPCTECINSKKPFFFNLESIENAINKKIIDTNNPNPIIECNKSYEEVPIADLLALVDYENLISHIRPQHPNKLERIEELLERLSTKMDNLILLNTINSEKNEYLETIFSQCISLNEKTFKSLEEENKFYSKVEEYFTQLPAQEQKQLQGWQNGSDKHKLKVVLNLGLIKYERELEIEGFKLPTNWQEFKAIFVNPYKLEEA